MCVCGSSAADTENMNPDKAVDSVVRISSVADIESVSVGDRQKMYNPNHYQDDVVHVRVVWMWWWRPVIQLAVHRVT